MSEPPQIRPGRVESDASQPRIIAQFANAAQGNMAIQLVTMLGVPADQIGVIPPDRLPRRQGMLLSIPCADEKVAAAVETACRAQGAEIHRQDPTGSD
jgi:hypothetical protein